MAGLFSDNEIASLIAEPKPLPADWRSRLVLRAKRGHLERELPLRGTAGNQFRIILRQSANNPFDFSLILAHEVPRSNLVFRLRRYNGRSHEHSNLLERETFYAFHIHTATERYQEIGMREDSYAEPTVRYDDFAGAQRCLIADAGLVPPPGEQGDLFGEP